MRPLTQLLFFLVLLLGLFRARWPYRTNPRICEEVGYKLSPALLSALYRPFQTAEIDAARHDAGLGKAAKHQQPLAIWLVGPSAAGKSYLAREVALDLGVGVLPSNGVDAVLLDGSSFRQRHTGYQAVIEDGRRLNCVWQEAYPAMRARLQRQKAQFLHLAARQKLNVLIPHTCDYLSECAPLLYLLRRHGYTNHVIMVLGDRKVIQQRGMLRARATGKRYAPEEWDESVSHGFDMITLATGYAEFVWTTPKTKWLVRRGRPEDVFTAAANLGIATPCIERSCELTAPYNQSIKRTWQVDAAARKTSFHRLAV